MSAATAAATAAAAAAASASATATASAAAPPSAAMIAPGCDQKEELCLYRCDSNRQGKTITHKFQENVHVNHKQITEHDVNVIHHTIYETRPMCVSQQGCPPSCTQITPHRRFQPVQGGYASAASAATSAASASAAASAGVALAPSVHYRSGQYGQPFTVTFPPQQ